MIGEQFLLKLSDSDDSWFVCNQRDKCGKQGKGAGNHRRHHHAAGIKEQAMVLA